MGAALDRIGAGQVTVIGHSTGATVATALAEQRPGKVAALALIDIGPSPDAQIPERPPVRLVLALFPGRLLWHLKTKATIRNLPQSSRSRHVVRATLARVSPAGAVRSMPRALPICSTRRATLVWCRCSRSAARRREPAVQ